MTSNVSNVLSLTESMEIENLFSVHFRLARECMNDYLEKQLGTTDIPICDQPTMLDVKIPDALPEAFEKVLHYIYTDRIDCKLRSIVLAHCLG